MSWAGEKEDIRGVGVRMIEGWFEIRCEECDKIIGYAYNCSGEPCSWVYSCEECMNPPPEVPDV